MGHEVSALALQDETRVLEFDEKYKEHIPLGTLVNLVQRGILYTESELMVDSKGDISALNEHHLSEDFNLVQALQIDKENFLRSLLKEGSLWKPIPRIIKQVKMALVLLKEKPKRTILILLTVVMT